MSGRGLEATEAGPGNEMGGSGPEKLALLPEEPLADVPPSERLAAEKVAATTDLCSRCFVRGVDPNRPGVQTHFCPGEFTLQEEEESPSPGVEDKLQNKPPKPKERPNGCCTKCHSLLTGDYLLIPPHVRVELFEEPKFRGRLSVLKGGTHQPTREAPHRLLRLSKENMPFKQARSMRISCDAPGPGPREP